MSHLNKSPFNKNAKQNSVNPKIASYSSSNPFDSDDELDNTASLKPTKRTSEPAVDTPNFSANPFDDSGEKQTSSSLQSLSSAARSRYRNDFHDSGGLENQSVQELENYAVYKAEETTSAVNNCLKIAEDMREDATKTLVNLHYQGEQMTRTHSATADIDHDLSRSEKLLGSLGGLFSKTWKPKKTSPITGPVITRDDPAFRRGNHLEQRERLGLSSTSKGQSNIRTPLPEPTNALQKVEVEIGKQDDALSDLSNILGELKDMAVDMGTEIDRQTEALGHVQEDVEVLNTRVLDANRRGRRLLGK
ncbi:SNAP25ous protein [Actinidia chinensis var. chinensis]|uniref:SNAP25ous protein n=1 Tax=Actinidia chinensis var. chinensis TaxID=1590841 RepID=A0A2R6PS12_ACTCC|nr:SNAP25ous protein [Actinidia chinensis var. chinensis]